MNDDLADLRRLILRVHPDSRLQTVPDHEIARIREEHPDVPEHYISFLSEVGMGRLGEGDFHIFGGPIEPDEVFDAETAADLRGILLFGSDGSEWMGGFDTTNSWRIVGVSCELPEPIPEPCNTMAQFFTQRIEDRLRGYDDYSTQ